MKYYVVEIATGERVSKGYHNSNGAVGYCEDLNYHSGQRAFKIISE